MIEKTIIDAVKSVPENCWIEVLIENGAVHVVANNSYGCQEDMGTVADPIHERIERGVRWAKANRDKRRSVRQS